MAITDIKEAFRLADETGKPQEVLGVDGKRVMLIVCPKAKNAARKCKRVVNPICRYSARELPR